MTAQQCLNLIIVIAVGMSFVVLGRKVLCNWSAALYLTGLSVAMFLLATLEAWVFGKMNLIPDYLLLHGRIASPSPKDLPFGVIPFAYGALMAAGCAVISRIFFRSNRKKL